MAYQSDDKSGKVTKEIRYLNKDFSQIRNRSISQKLYIDSNDGKNNEEIKVV